LPDGRPRIELGVSLDTVDRGSEVALVVGKMRKRIQNCFRERPTEPLVKNPAVDH
jgi:hypothetical protein